MIMAFWRFLHFLQDTVYKEILIPKYADWVPLQILKKEKKKKGAIINMTLLKWQNMCKQTMIY